MSFCYVSDTTKDIRRKIGLILKHKRVSLSFSQKEVAEMTGLTVNTISRLEQSGNISLQNLLLVCQALQLQPRDLFWEDIHLTPPYEILPSSRKRLDLSRKLDQLVNDSPFFLEGKRVAEVLVELKENSNISNKVSVLLSQYCKKGQLTYFMDGPIKRYQKIENN